MPSNLINFLSIFNKQTKMPKMWFSTLKYPSRCKETICNKPKISYARNVSILVTEIIFILSCVTIKLFKKNQHRSQNIYRNIITLSQTSWGLNSSQPTAPHTHSFETYPINSTKNRISGSASLMKFILFTKRKFFN